MGFWSLAAASNEFPEQFNLRRNGINHAGRKQTTPEGVLKAIDVRRKLENGPRSRLHYVNYSQTVCVSTTRVFAGGEVRPGANLSLPCVYAANTSKRGLV